MTALSIIVPVFNVEAYIERCITSILNNHLFDIHCELIVVDDGSPDRSIEIVERLTAGRSNVTLIRQSNRGLGLARNAGQSKAAGDYLWFVDSDDWLPERAIERVISVTTSSLRPDVVNIDYVTSDGRRTAVQNHATPDRLYHGVDYLGMSYVQSPVQYYIFCRHFYRENSLHFERGIYHEDALFTPIALFLAQRVVRLAQDCYVYNTREGSIMTSGSNLKRARDMLGIVARLEAFRHQNATNATDARVLARYSAVAIGSVFYYWRRLTVKERCNLAAQMDLQEMIRPILLSGLLKYVGAVGIMLCHKYFRRFVM